MPDNLSPGTKERIQTLCRRISDEHELDSVTRRKLYVQMEEKFLGFLRGSEKLTEEKAFLLVQEHFGDPELIGNLLRKTHKTIATLNVFQNAGILVAVTLFSVEITGFLSWPVQILENWVFKGIAAEYATGINTLIRLFLVVLPIILLWKGLDHTEKALHPGSRSRKLAASSVFISGSLFFVYALYVLLAALPWMIQLPVVNAPDAIPVFIRRNIGDASDIGMFLIWMLWLKDQSHYIMAAVTGIIAFMTYRFLAGYTHGLVLQWFIDPNSRYAFLPNFLDDARVGLVAVMLCAAMLMGMHLWKKSPAAVIVRR